MRHRLIHRTGSRRLILIYAGWGMDWRPFANLTHPGYDIMVVWDYRELSFSWRLVLAYDEVCLIAWSMGVFAASVTIHEIAPRITMRIAVNGTLTPIDDRRGIPPAIWRGTYNALAPATWRKFQRRMCTDAAQFARFSENAPKRTIADLAEELLALEQHTLFHVEQVADWDMAVVSRNDGIFPPAAQVLAWRDKAPVRMLPGGHLPDFAQLIARLVIDKDKVADRFDSAVATYPDAASVQNDIATRLMDRFNVVFGHGPIVGNVIEVGPGPGAPLTRLWIHRTDPRAKLRLWDLAAIDVPGITDRAEFSQCDAEVQMRRQPSASAGFIFSSSTVQWFNSPREFIKECERVLVPGGYLVLSAFVQGNLAEITEIAGNGLQLPAQSGWTALFGPKMSVLSADTEVCRLTFDSPREVMEHLRRTGVNAVNFGSSATVVARRILREYRPDANGRYPLTYRPVYIVARKADTP